MAALRRIGSTVAALALAVGLGTVGVIEPAAPAAAALLTGEAVTLPSVFRLVHSNGAEVTWSRYAGTTAFDKYEVHRSATAAFTPSSATLLTTIRDKDVTAWQDTTAKPGVFYYKVVSAGAASNEVAVTLPAAGQAVLTLQPDAANGKATYVAQDTTTPVGCYNYNNYGTANLRIGTNTNGTVHRPLLWYDLRDIPVGAAVASANLQLWYPATSAPGAQIDLHRLTRAWLEGKTAYPGACSGSGANWRESRAGVGWASGGGDIDGTPDASIAAKSRTAAGSDTLNVLNLVREWVNGTAPNHGMLLKFASEALPTSDMNFDYYSDDYSVAGNRPKLTVTFTDGSVSRGPRVSLTSPSAGSKVRGSVDLAATAADDRRVAKVDFLVDGALVATDTTAPYTATWDSALAANGTRSLTARATDDVGNVTTSAATSVTVDNNGAPSVTLTGPGDGTTVTGMVTVTATASDETGVARVEFYADNHLIETDTSTPYSASWNTLDLLDTAFDGWHTLTAKAYDISGQSTTTALGTSVQVANTAGTRFQATFDLNDVGSADDDASVPKMVTGNAYARVVDTGDALSGSTTATASTSDVSALGDTTVSTLSLADAPSDGGTYYPPGSPTVAPGSFNANVTVTNTSPITWKGGDLRLWYRWYTVDGVVLFEGQGSDYFPQTFQTGKTKTIPVIIQPPALPAGADMSQVRLRFDLFDTAGVGAQRWYSANGNPPIDNPVIVNKKLEGALGLERFWQYDSEDVGAGMGTLTNVANGNMLLRWSPFFAAGRGLSTMVDLTYNSLEDHSDSPAGNNFSLSISGLSRLGAPIDIHPNKADEITGNTNKYVVVTDGDGTTHQFTNGYTGTDGITRFTEPRGVNLYLRAIPTNPSDRRWAVTRPDNVTFYYNEEGFPTAVTDRNGNTLRFVLEATPPGEDPGGPKQRVTSVVDPGGRSFTIDYLSRDEAKKAQQRGNVQRILDHSGSVLDFEYYDDGNLLRLIQRGGLAANGDPLPDRAFVFTYTTANGSGPAISDPAGRQDPDPHTMNQSTRVYSVRDPNGHETTYAYYLSTDDPQWRWKLKSRTDRTGSVTGYGYDIYGQVTTVNAPMTRTTKYAYDTTGKVTSITNPLDQITGVQWSTDYKVSKVIEPSGAYSSYVYNGNGYLLTQTNQDNETMSLSYFDSGVDALDTGRHLSLLATVTSPKGQATAADDYTWKYAYDSAGNVSTVTDPTNAVTRYSYNLAGSANPGTVSAMYDANGNPPSTFPDYDPSGQPTRIVDPLGNTTRFGYDVDGQLRWVQDANHASDSGTDERAYKTFMDYDAFHRLGRQSAPKSTAVARGTVIWSGVDFDANDNVVRNRQPHYGSVDEDPENGPSSSASYDWMDRPTLVASSDTSVDPAGERTRYTYDAAGRVTKIEQPKGVLSATVDDYTSAYAYDALDRVVRKTAYGLSTTQARHTHLCFDVAGDMRSVTSPRADLSTVTCPGNGPATVPFTATYTYDPAHRQLSATDPAGHQSRRSYDDNGNLETTEQDIDPATGRIAKVTRSYDQRDKPVKAVERFDGTARDVTTIVEYDPNGNRSKLVSQRGFDARPNGPYDSTAYYVSFYTYDAGNRLTRVELPHDARDNTERQYQHRAYDANGNLTWTSLPVTSSGAGSVQNTARTVMSYFDPGWLRTSDDPNNPRVAFDYTAEGWQSARTPDLKSSSGVPNNDQRMSWQYFADGQLKARMDQGSQPTTYRYDANNNLTNATDAAGIIEPSESAVLTEATYTGFNEVSKVRHRKQSTTVWTFSDYTYDPNGNVSQRRENGEEDAAGTQTKAPRTHQLTYDSADWLAAQLDLGVDGGCAGDQRIVNTFWSSGWERQRDVYRAGAGCVADPTTWPKKQTTNWTQYDNGKLRLLTTKNNSGAVTESHDVTYIDAGLYINGNRVTDHYVLKRNDGNTSATTCLASSPCDATFVYDARDRLISHQLRAGRTDTYSFDEPGKLLGDTTIRGGNVTTEVKNGTTTSKRYTSNQLTDITAGGVTAKYWYDDLGNTDCLTLAAGTQSDCSPSDGGTASANLITDYRYDYLSRLESMRQYSSGTRSDRTRYTYDALDRTSREAEDHSGTDNDRTTTFTYQALTNQATEEKQSGGLNPKTKSFSYDNYGHRIAMTETDNTTGTTANFTYGRDVHGSVSQLIDDSGKVRASYGYNAYGGSDAPSSDPQALTTGDTDNLAPVNPYRYSSRRMDSGTASSGTTPSPVPNGSAGYDMGARRYGADTGTFIQQDMYYGALADLGLSLDPLTQNRYSLAGGNPISYMETDGHASILDELGDAIKEGFNNVVDDISQEVNQIRNKLSGSKNEDKPEGEDTKKEIPRFEPAPPKDKAHQLFDKTLGKWDWSAINDKLNNSTLPESGIAAIRDWSSRAGQNLGKGLSEGGKQMNFLSRNSWATKLGRFGRNPLVKKLGPVGAVAGFGASTLKYYQQGDKPVAALTKAGIESGTQLAGAAIGTAIGGAIGTAIGGPPGGFIGAAAGSIAGSFVGGKIGEAIVERWNAPITNWANQQQEDFEGDLGLND